MKEELKVKVNGGTLVAGALADPNNPGIYIQFETDKKDRVDIADIEVKNENGNKDIVALLFENVQSDECTRKFTLRSADIQKALYGKKTWNK